MEKDESFKWDTKDILKIIPAIIIAGVIFYFSSIPNPLATVPSGPTLEIDINSILHLCEYGLLSFLVAFGFREKTKDIYLISITIIYAFLDEVHQYFVPNRFFDIYDIITDSIGVILGFLAYIILEKIYNKFYLKE
ncbi:MAG: VanZ family protein [Promethearchaeota archaeon]